MLVDLSEHISYIIILEHYDIKMLFVNATCVQTIPHTATLI